MNRWLTIYLVGAIVTKFAVASTPLDNQGLAWRWPLTWLHNPQGMLELLNSKIGGVGISGGGGEIYSGTEVPRIWSVPDQQGCACNN